MQVFFLPSVFAGEVSPSYGGGGGWERATPVALFLSITHPMSATGVARSQRRAYAGESRRQSARSTNRVVAGP